MGWWFSATPENAYRAARLTDIIVAWSRSRGDLPYVLTCKPFPPGNFVQPKCASNVRKHVAEINPRAIIRIAECDTLPANPCMMISLAKNPDQHLVDEDQWNLYVHFSEHRGTLDISKVDIEDSQTIIE